MNEQKPAEADFTKTLAVVLLAEYLAVAIARAASLYLADASQVVASAAHVAALWLFVGVCCANLCTIAGAFGMRKDPTYTSFAATSLKMTSAQVVLLCISYQSDRPALHVAAAVLTAAMLLITIFFAQGKFLTLTPR
ncbi:MAG TPA: hypothetical protein VL500_01070 [Candidatus Eisenbacteria bacterium]|nr:hypothetical protein [Candidatus Eisenbacteria bacterium]